MKNIIAWGCILAVLALLIEDLSVFLVRNNLIPKIVAGTIVFGLFIRLVREEPVKTGKGKNKRRSQSRGAAGRPRGGSRPNSLEDITGRPSGSFSDYERQNF